MDSLYALDACPLRYFKGNPKQKRPGVSTEPFSLHSIVLSYQT